MKKIVSFLSVGFAVLVFVVTAWPNAYARYRHSANAEAGVSFTARLVDEKKNAFKKAAAVEVTVQGIRLVDPELASKAQGPIQGHLHYQLDDGAVIATSASEISFHELSVGEHRISVKLTDGNHVPIGMPVVLTVTVPAVETVMSY